MKKPLLSLLAALFIICLPSFVFAGGASTLVSLLPEGTSLYEFLLGIIVIFSIAWAVGVLARESSCKSQLKVNDAELNRAQRQSKGLPEEMTGDENYACDMRLCVIEHLLDNEREFCHYSDIMYAHAEMLELQKMLPTDNELTLRMNQIAESIRFGLTRKYLLWETPYGPKILIGGVVVSALLSFFVPFLAWLTLLPLALYGLFGRTPMVVARNTRGTVDGFFNILASLICGGVLGSASGIGSYTVTTWKERNTNRVVREETDMSPTGAAIIFTVLALFILLIALLARMEVFFLRNYVIYR